MEKYMSVYRIVFKTGVAQKLEGIKKENLQRKFLNIVIKKYYSFRMEFRFAIL